jgi:hypothetical protein
MRTVEFATESVDGKLVQTNIGADMKATVKMSAEEFG